MPSITSTPPPAMESHLLNKGALLKSQPVTPPNNSIGDNEVPKPNKTATAKLSIGAPKGTEYKRRAANGGHTIKPLLKPSDKARKSNLPQIFWEPRFLAHSGLQSGEADLLFQSMVMPIIIVTMLKP